MAQRVKKSIKSLRPRPIVSEFVNYDDLILRDWLAMQRTSLANERTLFAYIRTSLYLILGGIGLIEVEVFSELVWAGYAALLFSGIILVYGFVRYFALRHKLKKFYSGSDIGALQRIEDRDKQRGQDPEN